MSNVFICLGFSPNQFFSTYSLVFLLALPVFIYIIINIFKENAIHPIGHIIPIEIVYQSLMDEIYSNNGFII